MDAVTSTKCAPVSPTVLGADYTPFQQAKSRSSVASVASPARLCACTPASGLRQVHASLRRRIAPPSLTGRSEVAMAHSSAPCRSAHPPSLLRVDSESRWPPALPHWAPLAASVNCTPRVGPLIAQAVHALGSTSSAAFGSLTLQLQPGFGHRLFNPPLVLGSILPASAVLEPDLAALDAEGGCVCVCVCCARVGRGFRGGMCARACADVLVGLGYVKS
jgi:hypothetical protein